MKSIIEFMYYESLGNRSSNAYKSEPEFVETARIKGEALGMLMDSMTAEQKELYERYAHAAAKIEEIIQLRNFCHAFHLGAQLMAELMRGKEELLK